MPQAKTVPAVPPKEAMAWFTNKKLTPEFDYRDVWKQEHNQAFTVAKAMHMDVLTSIKDALDQSLANGETFATFKKNIQPTLEDLGWWGRSTMRDPKTGELRDVQLGSPRRLETIYRTNMETARQAGQWERIERNKRTHPYLLYELGPSKEHREEHVQWAGLMLPVDDPFWDTHRPKNGWGCKCRVRQISRREYDRLVATGKYTTAAPEIKYREWLNKRTGEVERVPVGIDPGWNYNPGKPADRTAASLKQLDNKLNAAPAAIGAAGVRSMVKTPAFADWYKAPAGDYPVGVLKPTDMQRIGATLATAKLSAQTAKKQHKEHPEIQPEEYQHIQTALENGWTVQDSPNTLIYVLEEEGYVTVVKSTKTGKAVFITSLRRLSANQAKRDAELQRIRRKAKRQK